MQLSNTPGKLLLPFAAVGGKNTIPVDSQIGIVAGKASLADGFPPLTRTPLSAGGVPPSGLDMNGILYEMSDVIRWANAGGGYAYDGVFAADANVGGYPKGARVMRSDGLGYWMNTVENNTTDPEDAGAAAAGWVPDYTSGAAAVTMTNANVTLTPLQYGKRIILLTGVLTANLNLVFPSIPGAWVVLNKCTGNFTVTCKTDAGTGFSTNIGSYQLVSGDGVNVYGISAELANLMFTQVGVGAVPRSAQDKAQEASVSVVDFMSTSDRTANYLAPGSVDVTYAFVAAVTRLAGGGKLLVPNTKFKLTDEIALPAGITVEGEGAGDNAYGAPPAANSKPTYLFQATPGKSIFFIAGSMNAITIKNMAMGASLNITAGMTPTTDGRYGIRCEGSFPAHSLMFRFEDLLFYDLERGISINDPFAQINTPPHTYDWNFCPVLVSNCRFLYPLIGLYINTNNIDFSTFINCAFSVPTGGSAIHLKATGYLRFIQCAGGGASVASNDFMYIEGAGVASLDSIVLSGCQGESLAHFIRTNPASNNATRTNLVCEDCIAEMGADIYLASNLHFISNRNHWVVNIYTDRADVRISSYDDKFDAGYDFLFVGANNASDAFVNARVGPTPPASLVNTSYDGGYWTFRGTSAPTTGKHKVGDRVVSNNTSAGVPAGFQCITAGTPGTWLPYGQLGFRSQAGTPVNTVTPLYAGEEFFDSANNKWYKSYDMDGSHWLILN